MKLFENILIGADPELFLKNPNSGAFVSAHEYVKGTKEEPWPVYRGAVQLDGMAAEFNIWPAKDANEFIRNISSVYGALRDMVAPSGYILAAEPVADFDQGYLDAVVPAKCKILGCNPDFNAWEMCPNDPPDSTKPFRTASGHIHVGWGQGFDVLNPDHFELCAKVSRQFDYYLGIHSLLWDPDNRRRELYGKAGAFRPKPYGMEYRVLSNAWLRSEILQRWVFFSAKAAMVALDNNEVYEDRYGDLAKDIIDGNDLDWFKDPNAPQFTDIPPPPVAYKKAA